MKHIFIIIYLIPAWCLAQSNINKSALVIGNSNYENQPLINPANDANDLTTQLTELGFKVFTAIDLTRSETREAIINYGDYVRLNPGVALFYYAGHGIQSSGVNYMIPIGADINREWEIQDECIKVNVVLRMLQSYKNPANIIILDACRNNPYARAFRSGERGLANQQYDFTGSIIAYATAPGMTASDGKGRNGLYTQELIKTLKIPGLPIEEVFKRVRINVSQLSNQQQIPWENSSLMGNYYFNETDIDNHVEFSKLPVEENISEAVPAFDASKANNSKSRAHIASDNTASLSTAFEIMQANDGRIDLELLNEFKKFKVSSFGAGNSIALLIAESYEYMDSSFLFLEKISFGRGSDRLLEAGLPTLDRLAEILNQTPEISVRIDTHTDFAGNFNANLRLSEARAMAVKDYLIDKGINKKRIVTKWYGGTQPINMARTEEARAENRRVEFRLINSTKNRLIMFNNEESKSYNQIKKILTNEYGFELTEKVDMYPADFLAELRTLKNQSFLPYDRLIVYINGRSRKVDGTDTELVALYKSNLEDPITCLDLELIKERIDQIPAQNIILITEFETVID